MSIFSRKNKNITQTSAASFARQMTPAEYTASRERKFQNRALWTLSIVGLATMVFSIWRISNLIQVQPVNSTNDFNSDQLSVLVNNTNSNTNTATLEELKAKDTDQDGLSDYDELYTHKTSPYIADSDSDGVSDKAEIDQGTDPNCPKGKECARNTNANTNIAVSNTNTATQTGTDTMTADQLRELLRSAGASDTDLQKIDDATLMQTYQQTLTEQTNSNANTSTTTGNTNTSSASQSVTYDQLKNLSAADIRQLLIQSGVDEATLNSVDDDTVRQVFLDALNQEMNGTNTNQ